MLVITIANNFQSQRKFASVISTQSN